MRITFFLFITALKFITRINRRKRKASRVRDKNVGSVFEQCSALARLRARLIDEAHLCGPASMDV
ncbi:hypothetical protein BBB56_11355 [Candidatus Pantoea deserta]|uniref:Uncharacterized protein n=1 Tax=Candidatus Pantoea deserta TaxID=1869313 RepID=A0A3N4P861_9GAMM|nr:hypothetical protein BBB56_11355 [Pantoea deserta]